MHGLIKVLGDPCLKIYENKDERFFVLQIEIPILPFFYVPENYNFMVQNFYPHFHQQILPIEEQRYNTTKQPTVILQDIESYSNPYLRSIAGENMLVRQRWWMYEINKGYKFERELKRATFEGLIPEHKKYEGNQEFFDRWLQNRDINKILSLEEAFTPVIRTQVKDSIAMLDNVVYFNPKKSVELPKEYSESVRELIKAEDFTQYCQYQRYAIYSLWNAMGRHNISENDLAQLYIKQFANIAPLVFLLRKYKQSQNTMSFYSPSTLVA